MLRVLLVDDSKATRRAIAHALEISGLAIAEVYEAENGAAALSLLQHTWIDLMLCDLYMPRMSGLELIHRMAADRVTSAVPIVIVSADHNRAHVEQLKRLGVRGYVLKPFQPDVLAHAVRQALGLTGFS